MSTLRILKHLLDEYYAETDRPVAWISAFTPSELVRSAGIKCFYPESYAASLAGNRKSADIFDCARANGYSGSGCSYALLFSGSKAIKSRYKLISGPDFLVATNNQCGTILYWWENLRQEYNVPSYFIDYPAAGKDFLPEEKQYIIGQYEDVIDSLEREGGGRFNDQHFCVTMANAIRANELWREIQLLRKKMYVPPRIFADALLPIVTMKGDSRTIEYYEKLIQDIKAEFSGRTVGKRILWLGYPFWFLREKYPELGEGAGIVMDLYTSWWHLDYTGETLMEKLVNAYGKTFLNMPLEWKLNYIKDIISGYGIDGVITHLNKSCKRDSTGLILIDQHLKRTLHIPTLVIESDMANPDWYNPESIRLNIDAFMELL